MIKVFTLNNHNKIELTKDELQKLLDEAYHEGFSAASSSNWIYTTPHYRYPEITCTTTTSSGGITMSTVSEEK